MRNTILTGLIAGTVALTAIPAHATDVNTQIDLCVAAISGSDIATVGDYRTKLKRISGASAKKLVIELIPTGDGEKLTAECTIRRDKVREVTLKT